MSYVAEGSAKVWGAVNGTSNAILGSFNVTSVTDNGTGLHSLNYTSAMSDANYATQTSHLENQLNCSYNLVATGSVRIDSRKDDGTLLDISNKSGTVFGDLA